MANARGLKLTNHIRPLLSLVSGALPPVSGFVWFTDDSRKTEATGLESMGNLWEEGAVFL
jgi:hypothetical protein